MTRWLPAIVALVGLGGNVAYIARWGGAIETRLAAVETHAQSPRDHVNLELFVTRAEYLDKVRSRDLEFAELRSAVRENNAKLDRLYQLLILRTGKDAQQ